MFYLPDFPCSNSDLGFQVLKGENKVSNYMTFNTLNSLSKLGNVAAPKIDTYILSEKLNKTELITEIRRRENLNYYIRSASLADEIPWDYMVNVCLFSVSF